MKFHFKSHIPIVIMVCICVFFLSVQINLEQKYQLRMSQWQAQKSNFRENPSSKKLVSIIKTAVPEVYHLQYSEKLRQAYLSIDSIDFTKFSQLLKQMSYSGFKVLQCRINALDYQGKVHVNLLIIQY